MSQSVALVKDHKDIEVWCNHYRIKESFGSEDARNLLYKAIASYVNREMDREILVRK